MKNAIEIERKFIIKRPSNELLESLPKTDKSEIFQTYLESDVGQTLRVRKRVRSGYTEYTETKKVRIDGMSAYESERTIDEGEYLSLIKNIRHGSRTLVKTRYAVPYGSYVYEIDIYPEWRNTAIMEVELKTEDAAFDIPSFITVVREVTGMNEYSNSSMSMRFPDEISLL